MAVATSTIIAAAAVAGAAASVYQGQQQAKAQRSAADQAAQASAQQAAQAEQQFNRQNQKRPNVAGMTATNQQAAMGGAGGTMLTGPTGVDPTALTLGRNTLLGQ